MSRERLRQTVDLMKRDFLSFRAPFRVCCCAKVVLGGEPDRPVSGRDRGEAILWTRIRILLPKSWKSAHTVGRLRRQAIAHLLNVRKPSEGRYHSTEPIGSGTSLREGGSKYSRWARSIQNEVKGSVTPTHRCLY